MSSLGITELQTLAKSVRRDIVSMTAEANSGHVGGSLSSVEILTALYFNILRINPENPSWPERDRFVDSKAHACPVLYSVLARRGFFPVEELMTFRKINSRLQGHAHVKTPGVEMSGGSLGQGLSFGLGAAIAARLDRRDTKVYVLLGDGELEEGQIWEAAMAAPFHQIGNLTAIVDRNRIQNDRFTSEVMGLEPLGDRWQAFGWETIEIDGHDYGSLHKALNTRQVDKPTAIVAQTVKGKGVSIFENDNAWHHSVLNSSNYEIASSELS